MRNLFFLMIVLFVAVSGCAKKGDMDFSEGLPAPDPLLEPQPLAMDVGFDHMMPEETYADASVTSGQTYAISRGDTLWSIASRTYGDGQRWRDIVNANPGLEPRRLRVGQTIVLP